MGTRRYYAAYLQSVNTVSGDRWQAIVCPPIQRLEGDEFPSNFTGRFVWWERHQMLTKQRPKWVQYVEVGPTSPATRPPTGPNWHAAEPIVVFVRRDNIAEWIKDPTTPYPLIKLLERKAISHNIQIQGPTSIPQVVTSVPTS